ncbi:MAG: response regulator transcription factor [Actinobacteria bacterium]|nr:response regulator transcription factor [Actinomycetota bacterium]
MTEHPVRVLLADDHPVYRLGLRALLDTVEGVQVVGEAGTGAEAVAAAGDLGPDVVVMDLHMPDLDGIEATKRIVRSHPKIAVLILTYSDEDDSVLEAMRAGARGYVVKEAGKDAIVRAVQDVASGEMIFGASVASRLTALLASDREPAALPFPELTRREREVLELMAQGLNNAAIALRLSIGDKRVRNCVTDIYAKLGVADRPQAIILAREAGLGRNSAIEGR